MRSGSNLERVLESGRFAVTAEIGPPRSASSEAVRRKARLLKGSADAFNLTDNQTRLIVRLEHGIVGGMPAGGRGTGHADDLP